MVAQLAACERWACIDCRYAERWLETVDLRLPELRRRLGEDNADMADLRQNSPFAGALCGVECRKISQDAR